MHPDRPVLKLEQAFLPEPLQVDQGGDATPEWQPGPLNRNSLANLTDAEFEDLKLVATPLVAINEKQGLRLLKLTAMRVSQWKTGPRKHGSRMTQGVKNQIEDLKQLENILQKRQTKRLPSWIYAGIRSAAVPKFVPAGKQERLRGEASHAMLHRSNASKPNLNDLHKSHSSIGSENLTRLIKLEFEQWSDSARQDLFLWMKQRVPLAARTTSTPSRKAIPIIGKKRTADGTGQYVQRKTPRLNPPSIGHTTNNLLPLRNTAAAHEGRVSFPLKRSSTLSRTPILDSLLGKGGALTFKILLSITDFVLDLRQHPGWKAPVYDRDGKSLLDYDYVLDETHGFFQKLLQIHEESLDGSSHATRRQAEDVLRPIVENNEGLIRKNWWQWRSKHPGAGVFLS